MKIIIYDDKNINIHACPEDIVIYSKDDSRPCVGCFSCWIKHPCRCIYKDCGSINRYMAKAEEMIIVSKNTFGGFSSSIKRHIDRSLSFVMPFFTFRNGLMRHKKRYNNNLKISAFIYGEITDKEKETASNSIWSLAENLGISVKNIIFKNHLSEVNI